MNGALPVGVGAVASVLLPAAMLGTAHDPAGPPSWVPAGSRLPPPPAPPARLPPDHLPASEPQPTLAGGDA